MLMLMYCNLEASQCIIIVVFTLANPPRFLYYNSPISQCNLLVVVHHWTGRFSSPVRLIVVSLLRELFVMKEPLMAMPHFDFS